MIQPARTLLVATFAVAATVGMTVTAHAAVRSGAAPASATATVKAVTTTTTTHPTTRSSSATTAKTPAKTTAPGAPAAIAAAVPAGPAVYRVQAGAARTKTGATSLRTRADKADPAAQFRVTGVRGAYRVVSNCRTHGDAYAIKATLSKAGIATLAYTSHSC